MRGVGTDGEGALLSRYFPLSSRREEVSSAAVNGDVLPNASREIRPAGEAANGEVES